MHRLIFVGGSLDGTSEHVEQNTEYRHHENDDGSITIYRKKSINFWNGPVFFFCEEHMSPREVAIKLVANYASKSERIGVRRSSNR